MWLQSRICIKKLQYQNTGLVLTETACNSILCIIPENNVELEYFSKRMQSCIHTHYHLLTAITTSRDLSITHTLPYFCLLIDFMHSTSTTINTFICMCAFCVAQIVSSYRGVTRPQFKRRQVDHSLPFPSFPSPSLSPPFPLPSPLFSSPLSSALPSP